MKLKKFIAIMAVTAMVAGMATGCGGSKSDAGSDSTGSDVSLSFSISGYGVSVGVGLGKKASGVTGYALNCPANKACKIYVKKKIRVKLYKVTVSYEGQVYSVSNVPVKTELALYLSNGIA